MISQIFVSKLKKLNLHQIQKYKFLDLSQKNILFQSNITEEDQYFKKLDKHFAYFPTSTQITEQETNNIKQTYIQLIDVFSNPKFQHKILHQPINNVEKTVNEIKNQLKIQVDKQFLTLLYNEFHNLVHQGYKLNKKEIENNNLKFDIKHLGHLHILGIDIERDNNKFIHQYTYKRFENELKFEERASKIEEDKENAQEDEISKEARELKEKLQSLDLKAAKNQKKEKMQKELLESFKEHKDSKVRTKLKEVFGKFGMKYGENDDELFAVPDVKGMYKDAQQNLLKSVNKGESYILVEDFQIKSNIGIFLEKNSNMKNITYNEKYWEQIEQQQNQVMENQEFQHFIRTHVQVFEKEAPSVRNSRKRTLIDFDGYMLGNPPLNVQRFDL